MLGDPMNLKECGEVRSHRTVTHLSTGTAPLRTQVPGPRSQIQVRLCVASSFAGEVNSCCSGLLQWS
ncbi:hypothetical protein VFPPC_16208 [Pochonia chlamydosporia 170]|uniref:Uncharacterized protein n=1 Tax=Pochonia chlamydosporia 170 TaxID=1380566 RepID=A0A179FFL2_METCM|nr:hypothetical protein VFPPC_16208 [Pochonia chlamydosporia 170]OAQ64395.1 hypothetical protein VFPPC_16208 [Pochonia chlamydosporia 170]